MRGGTLGPVGDLLSVVFICFIFVVAAELYCSYRRKSSRRSPPPLPATTPPPDEFKHFYLLRWKRTSGGPAAAPPLLPDTAISAGHLSPVACTLSAHHPADLLAKLFPLDGVAAEEHDVDELLLLRSPRLLFTIKEETKEEELENSGSLAACCNEQSMCANAPAAARPSRTSSASSDGLSFSTPCPSPSVSTPPLLSASSSPFSNSPPRSSFRAPGALNCVSEECETMARRSGPN